MKNLIASALVLTAIVFTSCSKNETPAPVNPANYQINVEYRVESVSGHFVVEYNVPEGNHMIAKQYQIDRSNNSYTFTCTNGLDLKVKAYNSTPSGKEVSVTILVNGVVFKTGDANAPGAIATAEGTY
jgi:hypothetical protein